MTRRLYLDDSYLREFDAVVVAGSDGWCSLSASAFHPGGGGQPCDRGHIVVAETALVVGGVREDDGGAIWHHVERDLAPGTAVRGVLDWPHRYAVMRHHALLHIVNTIAFRHFNGLITGAQIGAGRSRIDLKLADFARERIGEFEELVNEVIVRDLALSAATISEDEYRRRPELIRTLNVLPPVIGGRVRIVEIAGFDSQACGGTHVHSTSEIGRVRVAKFDNKGKDNKRFYWETVDA